MRARSPEERHLHRDLLLAAELAVESGHGQIMRGILVSRLLRVLRGRRVEDSVHKAAAAALGEIGAPAVPGLLAALRDADWWVHQAAAEALEQIGAPAVLGLLAALRDANADVRRAAA